MKKFIPFAITILLLSACTSSVENKVPISAEKADYPFYREVTLTTPFDPEAQDYDAIEKEAAANDIVLSATEENLAGRSLPLIEVKRICKEGRGDSDCTTEPVPGLKPGGDPENCLASGECFAYRFGPVILYWNPTQGDDPSVGNAYYRLSYQDTKRTTNIQAGEVVHPSDGFMAPMNFGANGPIMEAMDLGEAFAFTFRPLGAHDDGSDVMYQGKTLNEKFAYDMTRTPFLFRQKIGFVARKGKETFIVYDGQRITPSFDAIPTWGCCLAFVYPLVLSEEGRLSFLGFRESRFVVATVDLTKLQ